MGTGGDSAAVQHRRRRFVDVGVRWCLRGV